MKSNKVREFVASIRLDRGNAEYIVIENGGKLNGGILRAVNHAVMLAESEPSSRIFELAQENQGLKEAARWRDIKEERPEVWKSLFVKYLYRLLDGVPQEAHGVMKMNSQELWYDDLSSESQAEIIITHWRPID